MTALETRTVEFPGRGLPRQAEPRRARRACALAAALFVLIGAARIASTYPVFSQTADEPAHIACGMQWLDRGRYDCELYPLLSIAARCGA